MTAESDRPLRGHEAHMRFSFWAALVTDFHIGLLMSLGETNRSLRSATTVSAPPALRGGSAASFGQADAGLYPAQRRGRVPRGSAEYPLGGRHQNGPHQRRVDEHGEPRADAAQLQEADWR